MEKKSHILCIDDDDKIRELLEIFLNKHNFVVSTAKDAFEGEKTSELFSFDLIVLDIMMPKKSGIEFLNKFRKTNTSVPIIMLTANSQLEKKTKSFNFGCDDYLIKPFEPIELVLRINKLLNPRINKLKKSSEFFFGEFKYNLNTKSLKKNEKHIGLTGAEQYLLEILVNNINKEVSREFVIQKLKLDSNLRSIDVLVNRLRKKITSSGNTSFLKTIRGKGYMLISEYE
ncbi:MAG: DNA-binding response regulator [Alphaproteobacteria bacterium]|jgi:two-component system phosphate regulon response regulator OmpR|nr:DNA-binding response regulator [Alphaproteobacteria bacterium]|tara:strand:+ start:2326 stop:3012 length:687 start_codon:yes stop_codon:yes gene_type:complete